MKHDSDIDEDGDKIMIKVCRACSAQPIVRLIDLPVREKGFGKVTQVLRRRDYSDLEGTDVY